jgi:hypothetical protein
MNRLYNLIDRITPKNYWLQLLTLTFYTIFISICFNLIIINLVNLPIGNAESKALNFFRKNIFLHLGMIVIIGPLAETMLFQWLPVFFYTYFRGSKKYEVLFWIITGCIFGLLHNYSFGYQIAASITGLILVLITMYYSEKEKNYFFPIFFIHLTNNLLVFLVYHFKK